MTKVILTSKDSVPLRIYAGVKNDWTVSMFNDDGTVLDATGFSYFCQVRDRPGGKLLATMTVDLTDIATGVFTMTLSAANSALLGERSGSYDVVQQEDIALTNIVRLYGGDVEIIPVNTVV